MTEEAVHSILTADNSITAACTSIRPVALAQGDEKPFLTYQVTNVEEDGLLDGPGEWVKETITIDVYADTYAEAASLSKLIKERLHYYPQEDRGDVATIDGEVADVEINNIAHLSTNDVTPPQELGQEKPPFRLSSDYEVMFREV